MEDNPANLELVEQLLARRVDLHLLCASDGNLGIELARCYQPKVILLDINLPGLSGIEVMQILRADPSIAHIPIIARSANATPPDIEQGLKASIPLGNHQPFLLVLADPGPLKVIPPIPLIWSDFNAQSIIRPALRQPDLAALLRQIVGLSLKLGDLARQLGSLFDQDVDLSRSNHSSSGAVAGNNGATPTLPCQANACPSRLCGSPRQSRLI